jgi:hypothetical protein
MQARKGSIEKTVAILRRWKLSPFEHEADVRHGLRSGLCLNGTAWSVADAEAAWIVGEALNKIGAKRPSYLEGQRRYVIPREDCAWCGGPVSDDFTPGGHSTRFCSGECARAAWLYWDVETTHSASEAYHAAMRVMRQAEHQPRPCAHCTKPFRPMFGPEIYCSRECAAMASRLIPERPCLNCGKMHRPQKDDRPFCSWECFKAHGRRVIHERECVTCGRPFMSVQGNTMFCSPTCRTKAHLLKTGKWIPKNLSPIVFDFFVRPAPRPLSPPRFDLMLEAA